MKKYKWCLLVLLICGLFLASFIFWLITTSYFIREDNYSDALNVVSERAKVNPEDINIIKIKIEQNQLFVLYLNNKAHTMHLLILKRVGFLTNYYLFNGESSTSRDIDTYNYKGPTENDGGIIVVYGNNTTINAYSYMFMNSGKTYRRVIKSDYFIHVYLIDKMIDTSSSGYLYSENGQIISLL